jgi:hypothetical protein
MACNVSTCKVSFTSTQVSLECDKHSLLLLNNFTRMILAGLADDGKALSTRFCLTGTQFTDLLVQKYKYC